jgi:hypothetical protein
MKSFPCYLWMDISGSVSFCPVPVGEPLVISVPIGWKMESSPKEGVILRDIHGNGLSATNIYELALLRRMGFKIPASRDGDEVPQN